MKTLSTVLSLCATLAACGGGGGGGGSPTTDTDSKSVPLTAQNYDAAATEVMASSATLLGSSNVASNILIGADVIVPTTVVGFVQKKLPDMLKNLRSQQAKLVGAVVTNTEKCASGGTLSISQNDVDGNNNIDPGDNVTLFANNCVEDGVTTDGQLTITVKRYSKSFDISSAMDSAMSIQSNQFSSKVNGVTTASNGAFDMDLKSQYVLGPNGYLQQVELKISISSLNYNVTSAASTKVYEYRDYALQSISYNNQTTQTIKGSINIPTLGSNTAAIETLKSFVSSVSWNGSSYVSYPTDGVALVTFKQGGKIRATANGTSSALVELDLDGDGKFETSKQVPWSDIL